MTEISLTDFMLALRRTTEAGYDWHLQGGERIRCGPMPNDLCPITAVVLNETHIGYSNMYTESALRSWSRNYNVPSWHSYVVGGADNVWRGGGYRRVRQMLLWATGLEEK